VVARAPIAWAEESDFYTAVQLFKLSLECPFKPFSNNSKYQVAPIRGLLSNQVTTDEQGIWVFEKRQIDTFYEFNNTWNRIVQRDRARINFADLYKFRDIKVNAPNELFIPTFSLYVDANSGHGYLNFAVCDEERANNAKTALEALIALSKAADGHLVGLPEPLYPTTQGGCAGPRLAGLAQCPQ
jgi:hypothetical protein